MGTSNRLRAILVLCCFIIGMTIANTGFAASDMSTRNRIKIRKKSQMQRVSPDDSEEYSLEKMELLNNKRKNLIQDIKRFIRESNSADQKSELNLRLGSLYMEDYHANLARAQQIYDRDYAAYQKELNAAKDKKKFKKPAPKLDNAEAIGSLDRARAIYKDLITRYPNHPRRDEMYYFMALASLDRGNTEEGMHYFKELTERNPNSRYVNEALIQLGDHHFDNNRFPTAEGFYDKVIAKKHLALMPYATYKKAWCRYNQQQPSVALKLFMWVVQNEDITDGETTAPIRIKNEALKDITLPFVDLKMVQPSIDFFRNFGDKEYRRGLETMAALYQEAGEYQHSITLWENLLALDPNHAKNASYDLSVVESLKMKHDETASINRLFEKLPNYMQNSNWYEINVNNAQVLKDAATGFEETAWKYAVQYHSEAQRTKNEELYALSRRLYAKYLDFFPRTARAPKARFQLAEILYKQAKYVEAADQYYRVYKDSSAGDLRPDAIKSALMSLDRQLNLDRKKLGLKEITTKLNSKLTEKDDVALEFVAFSDVEGKFLLIGEEYLKSYPKAKDAPDVLYEMAYLQYLHHDFNNAYTNFWNLVKDHGNHETVYSASYLIMDVLNRKKDYVRLVAACKRFLATSNLTKGNFRADVSDVLRKGELKRIQTVEEKGDYKQAAEDYIEYTKAYGAQDEALFEKALYNAGVNYTKTGAFLIAVETQEKFLRRFPKSTLKENLLLQVAKTYELLAMFEKSAMYYEQLAVQFPKNSQVRNAHRLAGLYYWGAGNLSKAESLMISYSRMYPTDRKLIEKDLLDLYESSNNNEKLINFYMTARVQKGIPASDFVAYSLKVAEIQAKEGGRVDQRIMDEAFKTAQVFAKDMAETPKGVEAMSKILFWFANKREAMFYNIKLTLPQRQLEINLQRKLVLLKEIEREYGRVASLGSAEWGLGAMYKTALAYRTMAQDVTTAPIPSELSAEQVDMYRAEIDKTFVKPFNEKAKQMATSCLDKAQEYNLLSSWTPKCYTVVAEVDPQGFPMVRTFYLPPLHLAVMQPKEKATQIPVGNMKTYAYPFFSYGLFSPSIEARAIASAPTEQSNLYMTEAKTFSDGPGMSPSLMNYRLLADDRKEILTHALNQEKPADVRKGYSFAFLNLLRLMNPQRALPLVQESIQKDPQSMPLHNLLGLTYFELGNYPAAKITWLAAGSRGKNSSIWNNLGVLAHVEGRESQAIEYFNEATLMDESREALTNLGFVALKFRNGFEAKKHFEKALQIEKNEVTPQVGLAVAQLQNRELEAAKDKLVDLSRKYKTDPYARISLSYFIMDVDKDLEVANRVLWDYMDAQQADNDLIFRQAVQEAKRRSTGASAAGEELPGIQ